MKRPLQSCVTLSVSLLLAASGAFGARDVALIHLDENGCPREVTPETPSCPSEDRKPDRICRWTTPGIWRPNRNKLLWQYAEESGRDRFTIRFEKPMQEPGSPFTADCGTLIESQGSRPKTSKCRIDRDAIDSDRRLHEFHYTVVVHRQNGGDCELDPHIYVLH